MNNNEVQCVAAVPCEWNSYSVAELPRRFEIACCSFRGCSSVERSSLRWQPCTFCFSAEAELATHKKELCALVHLFPMDVLQVSCFPPATLKVYPEVNAHCSHAGGAGCLENGTFCTNKTEQARTRTICAKREPA